MSNRWLLWFVVFLTASVVLSGFSLGLACLTGALCATIIEVMLWFSFGLEE